MSSPPPSAADLEPPEPLQPEEPQPEQGGPEGAAEDLSGRLAGLEAAVDGLGRRIMADSERAAARERVIDRQHEEVERLRSERRASPLRPVTVDLARLRNDLLHQAAMVPANLTRDDVATLLGSYADQVEEALERCGVAVLPPETGGVFTPGRQQAAGFVETDDPARDGTVAEVVGDGYAELDGKVVVPARVTLHRVITAAGGTDSTIDSTEGTDD